MKRRILTLLLLIVAVFSLQAAKPKKDKLNTLADSASYALGFQVGMDLSTNLKNLPTVINMDYFIESLSNALKSDTNNLSIQKADMNEIVQRFLMQAEAEREKSAQADNKIFLEGNKKKPTVKTTESGLQYEVLKEGSGARPKETDKVKVHYKGTLLDGTVFDSSIERGTPLEIELNKVIRGWTEGVQLMTVGSKYRFYIPPELGYGTQNMGIIKPYSILIFEVELLDIVNQTTPAETSAPHFQFEPYQRNANQ